MLALEFSITLGKNKKCRLMESFKGGGAILTSDPILGLGR